MKRKLFSLISAAVLVCFACCAVSCEPAEVDPIDDDYRVFYQIFVGSFSDSDGDGTGDIRGIINRMDYLNDGNINGGNDLGVQGIWLSPIFESPSYHKYDVADYYTIDSDFGTEEDLAELLEICHERNVKVILDLAINHTSNKNNWFTQFLLAHQNDETENKYYDFYSWQTGTKSGYNIMTGCGNEYYECNFDSGMPELNYDNDDVREQMVDVAKYWLDLGVDGFRFDAIKYIYYGDNEKSAEFWDWYIDELKQIKPDIYTVGECYDSDSVTLEYYSALNCFDFSTADTSGRISEAVRSGSIRAYTTYIESYQKKILAENSNAMMCLFVANHDMNRAAGYLTVDDGKAYMAANLYLLCSGSPFIYYGEEIGMKGTKSGNTDANRRLAMLWGDGDTVEDPTGATFSSDKQPNGTVKQQLRNGNSLLRHYAKVISLRNKYPEIARGSYTSLSINGGAGGFKIVYNDSTIALIHNVTSEEITIDLPEGFEEICDYIGLNKANIKNGKLVIGAQTSVILK